MSQPRPFGPEGPECEWKERPPRPERLARTLAAFHNGAGGSIWIGVADDGRLVGITDMGEAGEAVRAAAACCDPPPELHLSRRRVAGVQLLEVRVARGAIPCRVRDRDGRERVYVRDGASSRVASPDDLRRLERGENRRIPLDPKARKLLGLLAQRGRLRKGALARAMCIGERTCRRTVVPLLDAGLVQCSSDGYFSLTPRGYRRIGS